MISTPVDYQGIHDWEYCINELYCIVQKVQNKRDCLLAYVGLSVIME